MNKQSEYIVSDGISTEAVKESYEEIVKKWYVKLRPSFTALIMKKYGYADIRVADVENIYQDVFLAIRQNLQQGRIAAGCDWKNYIIRIGLNMASKEYRNIARKCSLDEMSMERGEIMSPRAEWIPKAAEALKNLQDDEVGLIESQEVHELLCRELDNLPEPCSSIIMCRYILGMTDVDIAGELEPYRSNGKSLEVNAKAIKARRWTAMQELAYRVKRALFKADITDVMPEKHKRCRVRA